MTPRVKPVKRDKLWQARYPLRDGGRKSAGVFKLKGPCNNPGPKCCAQHVLDEAVAREWGQQLRDPQTVGAYARSWTKRHPRSDRTNYTNDRRLAQMLPVFIEGVRLRDWRLDELKRRHAVDLVAHLLVEQGRAAQGALGMIRTLSAMCEDAITDEVCEANPFLGVKVRASDPRVVKAPRKIRVWSFEQSHDFAHQASLVVGRTDRKTGRPVKTPALDVWRKTYAEPMVRVLSDCGLRLGELMPLERGDVCVSCHDCRVPHLHVRRTAHEGRVIDGTKTDHGEVMPGRVVPVPPGLWAMLDAFPPRIDTRLLFTTPSGKLWRERNAYRDIWDPTREATGMDCTPQEFRHSYVTALRAAGVDPADLAAATGHSVQTADRAYVHALGQSFEQIREAIG